MQVNVVQSPHVDTKQGRRPFATTATVTFATVTRLDLILFYSVVAFMWRWEYLKGVPSDD